MHNSYFLFRILTAELRPRLCGGVISQCFSQEKDELVVQIETHEGPFFIRAVMWPVFSCISFPDNYNRAGKNTIDLFRATIGRRITDILAVENDRSFYLLFSCSSQMLFKMHGNRANVLWLEHNQVKEQFKKQLTADADITTEALVKKIAYTRAAFSKHLSDLQGYFVTLDKSVWDYLYAKGFESKPDEEKWLMFEGVMDALFNPRPGIVTGKHGVRLTLLEENTSETFTSASQALTVFCSQWLARYNFVKEYKETEKLIKKRIAAAEFRLQHIRNRLQELRLEDPYRKYADLLMAHLHEIQPGSREAVLNDFDNGKPITIKLRPELSAQKNAEMFYRKSRNRRIEEQNLNEQLTKLDHEHKHLVRQLEALKQISRLSELRLLRTSLNKENARYNRRLPYREILYKGFTIRIGRSARDNDELTLKYAHKNDLWLHVRDVPGSHVVVQHRAGKPFPKEVIERAAELAAWHSARRTEALCPVLITEKKYVRKRKGDAPGLVVAERSRTIMVEPKP